MGPKPKRYQQQRWLHFITFSCYRRLPFLDSVAPREIFERELERVRSFRRCCAIVDAVTARLKAVPFPFVLLP
jgi:hypothetical protein